MEFVVCVCKLFRLQITSMKLHFLDKCASLKQELLREGQTTCKLRYSNRGRGHRFKSWLRHLECLKENVPKIPIFPNPSDPTQTLTYSPRPLPRSRPVRARCPPKGCSTFSGGVATFRASATVTATRNGTQRLYSMFTEVLLSTGWPVGW